ncbi:MAG: class II D-tagatose-bisphosphate aldolase non-catalytic subunit, partial [Burkholderiales bacterium]
DCSMSCAGDPEVMSNTIVAQRSARLCAAAEQAWRLSGGEPPVYVIGTEVPVPGGAAEELNELAVTTPAAARATIETHRVVFEQANLGHAWSRVIAAVVQPGVEFDHERVVDYRPDKAVMLSQVTTSYAGFVFEAHSTDYQTPAALAQLVSDHFAILKVGPAVTFAMREALWALDSIERDWIDSRRAARLRQVTVERMKAEPRHWERYYAAGGVELAFQLEYSLSDRIRYYWPDPGVAAAQAALFNNLTTLPPPPALVSQYFPMDFPRVRSGEIDAHPETLVIENVCRVLDGYGQACQRDLVLRHA